MLVVLRVKRKFPPVLRGEFLFLHDISLLNFSIYSHQSMLPCKISNDLECAIRGEFCQYLHHSKNVLRPLAVATALSFALHNATPIQI